ncbi:SDR family oxidoreductase [Treponema pectinovorum]|uniref:SDR family oxidoreductase n=1 Tax=Treponema pectinovorum TaxID=164 RepID=UPI003D8A4E49
MEKGYSVKTLAIQCDITDTQQVNSAVDEILAKFGRIDILINNAGTGSAAPAEDMPDEQFNGELAVDLGGTFKVSRAVAKKAMILLSRYGNEGELDTATIFLASPTSSYVTGRMVPVDGGYTCM